MYVYMYICICIYVRVYVYAYHAVGIRDIVAANSGGTFCMTLRRFVVACLQRESVTICIT